LIGFLRLLNSQRPGRRIAAGVLHVSNCKVGIVACGRESPDEAVLESRWLLSRPFASRQRQENFNEISVLPLASVRGTPPRGSKYEKDFWQADVTKMIKLYGTPI
jgi:hypothetical protein